MNNGAANPVLDRRRFLGRACGLLLGLLPGVRRLAGRSESRSGPPEAAFYRPLRPPLETP